jgi:ERCC4-type nuclease
LLEHFGSVERLRAASDDELLHVLNRRQAAALRRFIESSKEAPILQRLTGTGYSNAQEK